jgi:4-amino-4-deoxy-L-arabinose transferase-like glycosyltransferase
MAAGTAPGAQRHRRPEAWIRVRRPSAATAGLVAILVLAALARALWVAYATRTPVGLHDPSVYLSAGDQISRGLGYRYVDGTGPIAYFPPGFPYALAAVFWVVRHSPLPDDLPHAATALNGALSLAAVGLVYALGRRLFGLGVALAAAALVALWPNLVFQSGTILSETLFIALALAALLVVLWAPWPGGRLPTRRLLAFGAVTGLAALTRPPALLFVVALAIAAWAGGAGPGRALAQAGIALLAAVAVIVPWTVRNAAVMHAPIPISTNLGDDLCIGHNPAATGGFEFSPYCNGPPAGTRTRREVLRNKANTKEALTYAVHHPWREVQLVGLRARGLFVGDHDGLDAVESYRDDRFIAPGLRSGLVTVADAWYYAVAACALLGVPAFVREDPRRLMVLLSMLALLLFPLEVFGDMRFHVPALPLVALIAAAPLARLAGRLRAGRARDGSAGADATEPARY